MGVAVRAADLDTVPLADTVPERQPVMLAVMNSVVEAELLTEGVSEPVCDSEAEPEVETLTVPERVPLGDSVPVMQPLPDAERESSPDGVADAEPLTDTVSVCVSVAAEVTEVDAETEGVALALNVLSRESVAAAEAVTEEDSLVEKEAVTEAVALPVPQPLLDAAADAVTEAVGDRVKVTLAVRLRLTEAQPLPVCVGDHVWLCVPLPQAVGELLAPVEGDVLTDDEGVTVLEAVAAAEADATLPVLTPEGLPAGDWDTVGHADWLNDSEPVPQPLPLTETEMDRVAVAQPLGVAEPVPLPEKVPVLVMHSEMVPEVVYE